MGETRRSGAQRRDLRQRDRVGRADGEADRRRQRRQVRRGPKPMTVGQRPGHPARAHQHRALRRGRDLAQHVRLGRDVRDQRPPAPRERRAPAAAAPRRSPTSAPSRTTRPKSGIAGSTTSARAPNAATSAAMLPFSRELIFLTTRTPARQRRDDRRHRAGPPRPRRSRASGSRPRPPRPRCRERRAERLRPGRHRDAPRRRRKRRRGVERAGQVVGQDGYARLHGVFTRPRTDLFSASSFCMKRQRISRQDMITSTDTSAGPARATSSRSSPAALRAHGPPRALRPGN